MFFGGLFLILDRVKELVSSKVLDNTCLQGVFELLDSVFDIFWP